MDYGSGKIISKATFRERLVYYLGHFLIYLGVVLIGLLLIWLFMKAGRIYLAYHSLTDHITALQTTVTLDASQLDRLETTLHSIADDLAIIEAEASPLLPLAPYLSRLPIYGDDVQVALQLPGLGKDLAHTGLVLVEALAPAFRTKSGTDESPQLASLALAVADSEGEIRQAAKQLQRQQKIVEDIEPETLLPSLAGSVEQINRYLPQAITILHLIADLPALLGHEEPQTYLILVQNSDELRPGGGYVTAAGHLVFDRGQIAEFVMQDSYAVDRLTEAYPYPPDPLYRYMGAEYWVIRDVSWSPHFPTAARRAIDLYELGQDIKADGVISFDQQALVFLLQGIGPVTVEGEKVASDNVIALMREHWAPESDQALDSKWWKQRKSFMLALAEAIRHKLEDDFASIKLPNLVQSLNQALAEKHILSYLDDSNQNDFFVEKKWSGALQPVEGDYVMVVDANVGFNKASAAVERQLQYQVTLKEKGSAQVQATIVYQHQAMKRAEDCSVELRYDPIYEQNIQRCYWNYMQVIVPAGAQLLRGPNQIVDGKYLLEGKATLGQIDTMTIGSDKLSWGQLFLLAPEERISLDYMYTLPSNTAQRVGDHWEYHLYLQKQPGTLQPTAEVTVILPEGARLLDSQPEPVSRQAETITYDVRMKTDQDIVISYRLSN